MDIGAAMTVALDATMVGTSLREAFGAQAYNPGGGPRQGRRLSPQRAGSYSRRWLRAAGETPEPMEGRRGQVDPKGSRTCKETPKTFGNSKRSFARY